MKIEMMDGMRVLRLSDRGQRSEKDADMLTMVHLWRLLSGGHSLRDSNVGPRRYL